MHIQITNLVTAIYKKIHQFELNFESLKAELNYFNIEKC